MKAKRFMQSLWKLGVEWDEKLPTEVQSEWRAISRDLLDALQTEIQRNLHAQGGNEEATLHVFTDASQQAYGTCAYLVRNGVVSLVMGKNRVAPLNQITLPRLVQLMGAVIGAILSDHIRKSTSDGIKEIVFWSDSQIVLGWLSSSKPQKQFVRNRIAEIKDLTTGSTWNYVPTECNPADLLTRGIIIRTI